MCRNIASPPPLSVYRDETEIVEQLSLILACLGRSRLPLLRRTMKKNFFLASPVISNIFVYRPHVIFNDNRNCKLRFGRYISTRGLARVRV